MRGPSTSLRTSTAITHWWRIYCRRLSSRRFAIGLVKCLQSEASANFCLRLNTSAHPGGQIVAHMASHRKTEFKTECCLLCENLLWTYVPMCLTGDKNKSVSHAHNRGHCFNSIPNILQANIFVFRMLIIIVVGNWNCDGICFENIFNQVKWKRAS